MSLLQAVVSKIEDVDKPLKKWVCMEPLLAKHCMKKEIDLKELLEVVC
jgi:hypothetical protein